MKQPTLIAIKYAAGGLLGVLLVTLVVASVTDFRGSAGAGAGAAMFVCMLFSSTRAAYDQGKKDALVERSDQKVSG